MAYRLGLVIAVSAMALYSANAIASDAAPCGTPVPFIDGYAVIKGVDCSGAIVFSNTTLSTGNNINEATLKTTMSPQKLRSEGSALHVELFTANDASLGVLSFGGFSSSCANRTEKRHVAEGSDFNYRDLAKVKQAQIVLWVGPQDWTRC